MIHGLSFGTRGRPRPWVSSRAAGSVVAEWLAPAISARELAIAGVSAFGISDPT